MIRLPAKPARRERRHLEDQHQRALFQWAAYVMTTMGPLRDFMFAIPNGGKRSATEAAIMKGLGVTAGVSDVMVMIASGGCHGMFIELKSEGNKPSEKQREFQERAQRAGYHCTWFDDWLEAKEAILRYLRRGNWLIEQRGHGAGVNATGA